MEYFRDGRKCFSKFLNNLGKLNPSFESFLFEYDFNQSLTTSARQLQVSLASLAKKENRPIHIVAHSMGGLVARLAVLNGNLPSVRNLILLATPNHGTLNGVQLAFLGQTISLATRTVWATFGRKPGVVELTRANHILAKQARQTMQQFPHRLHAKRYFTVPARYYHRKRDFGDKPPSLTMSAVTAGLWMVNLAARHQFTKLTPTHDGIVEERDTRLDVCPVGSIPETEYLDAEERAKAVFHVGHPLAANADHVSLTAMPEIADLVRMLLTTDDVSETGLNKLWKLPYPGRVTINE